MYKVTVAYDGEPIHFTQEFTDALEAFNSFATYLDWGFAEKYSTVNLSMPDGKMYTKVFYRSGLVITK